MKSYSIRPIPLTVFAFPLSNVFYRYGMVAGAVDTCVAMGTYVWCIEGASRNILVDAGASQEVWLDKSRMFTRHVQSLEQGLAKLGLKPEDIDLVAMTHLHWDHIASANKLTKAKFLVQKAELDFAKNPHPIEPVAYDPRFLKGVNFETIEGDYEIEEGLNLLSTPGHTPGGQSVVVNTAKGKALISCMCVIDDNYNPTHIKETLAVIAPATHTNLIQAYESVLKIKQAADIIIPVHEIRFAFMDRIPA